MKTTHKRQPKEQAKETKGFTLTQLFDGEIIMSKNVRRFYPYFLLLLVFTISIIISERSITKKQKQIKTYENEYKTALSELKKNNQFIPYQESQELLQIIEEKGFIKNDKNRYKIVVSEK